MSRSADALHCTIERMAEQGQLYCWTFTFPTVLDVKFARQRWALLSRSLVTQLGFRGVRVFELHDSHGLHIHAVALGMYPLRLVRAICSRFNFGRVHVFRIKANPFYICKYVTKTYRKENPWLKGSRLWAWIGDKSDCDLHSKVKDIVYTSPSSTIARELIRMGHAPFSSLALAAKIHCSLLAGDLLNLKFSSWAMYYLDLLTSWDRQQATAAGGRVATPPAGAMAATAA